MGSGLGGPKTKTIMMFGGEDDHFESGLLEYSYPLLVIEIGWVEQRRVFVSVTPRFSCECVDLKMHEDDQFELLPCVMLLCVNDICRQFYFLIGGENIGKSKFLFKIGIGSLVATCG